MSSEDLCSVDKTRSAYVTVTVLGNLLNTNAGILRLNESLFGIFLVKTCISLLM